MATEGVTWWTAHLQRMAVELAAIASKGKPGYQRTRELLAELEGRNPEYAQLRGMVNEIRSAQAAAKEVRDE